MTTTDLAAALLRDVPRYVQVNGSLQPTDGQHGLMRADEVLAALTAALDGVDERAGEIVSELREVAAVFTKDTVFTDAADLITALLAQNAALRAEAQEMGAGMVTLSHEHSMERARANAAEAREERLRGALDAIYEITVEPAETDHKNVRGWIEVTARAALTTEADNDRQA